MILATSPGQRGNERDRRKRTGPVCGDGGGSNSPSKACSRIASTSVVGDFFSRGARRAPTRSPLTPGRSSLARLPAARRAAAPLIAPFPARGAGTGRTSHCLGSESVRIVGSCLPAVRINEGERRSSARGGPSACPVETTHPRSPVGHHQLYEMHLRFGLLAIVISALTFACSPATTTP